VNKILFLCSWLEPVKKRGWFFVEQANYIRENKEHVGITLSSFEHANLFECVLASISFKINIIHLENQIEYFEFKILKFKKEGIFSSKINRKLIYLQFKKLNAIKDFQILHAQSLFDAGVYSYWISRKFKIKSILTEHNQLNFLDSQFTRRTIKNALKHFHSRIVVGRDLIKQFASSGFYYDFKIVNNPADKEFICADINLRNSISKECVTITHSGAYTPIKDQGLILNLLKLLDQDGLEIDFHWMGYNSWGKDEIQMIKRLIASQNYSENIRINTHKRLDKSEMVKIYNSTDLAISTSICETFGISAVEALAMGVPLLTTDNGGAREYATSENSVIVPIRDLQKLYEGFYQWFKNRNNYDSIMIAKKTREYFSTEDFVNKIYNVYNS
jgi:glycosyltransferase involved in cell wall biosynthesis